MLYEVITGSLAFAAVPAEEFIDFPLRQPLREEGQIGQLSGKLELIDRGFFSHAEFVIATHAAGPPSPEEAGGEVPARYINSVRRMSGFKVMSLEFRGRSSHAGAAPHKGINAQNARNNFV